MRTKRNATNIEKMARKFVKANKTRYCKHWNGHFCEICAELDLIVVLNDVLVAGRNEERREAQGKPEGGDGQGEKQ